MIQRLNGLPMPWATHPRFRGEPPVASTPSPFVGPGEAKNVPDPAQHLINIVQMRTQGFRDQFQAVLDQAKSHLKTMLKTTPTQKLAVVMDLDETLLDNSGYNLMKLLKHKNKPQGFTYMDWNQSSQCPAIPESLEFVKWVIRKKLPLFFVTSRVDSLRQATIENLKRIGIPASKYTIYTKPNQNFGKEGTSNLFKIGIQQELVKQGYTIGAMIGDQQTDIDGALGKGFLLPNVMYTSH